MIWLLTGGGGCQMGTLLRLRWESEDREVWVEQKGDSERRHQMGESGMLPLPLRGQVWTTIKTEFHWQPSGNNLHIAHKGQDIYT